MTASRSRDWMLAQPVMTVRSYRAIKRALYGLAGRPAPGDNVRNIRQGLPMPRTPALTARDRRIAEAPLFGKHVGRYFWQMHAAGSSEQGTVVKGYKVKPN
jgi:hypothetical protein